MQAAAAGMCLHLSARPKRSLLRQVSCSICALLALSRICIFARARFFVVPRCLFRRKRSPARSLGLFLARHNGAARTKAGVPKCTSSARAENECPRKLPASRKTDLAQTAARVRPLPLRIDSREISFAVCVCGTCARDRRQ